MFSWFVGLGFFQCTGASALWHSCLYIDEISGTEVAKLRKGVLQ